MKLLELFSGTGHISDKFRERGHKAWKVDWSTDLDANLHTDIMLLNAESARLLCHGKPHVVWASPDCTTYSIAATIKGGGFKHRNADYTPKTDYAKSCDMTNQHVIDLISELKPKVWFIENPRGMMRHMPWMINLADKLPGAKRYTITYCSYGGKFMKTTDIWTNHPNPQLLDRCKPNNPDCNHIRNPRGKTQKEMGVYSEWSKLASRPLARGIMPTKLIEHIVDICEERNKS